MFKKVRIPKDTNSVRFITQDASRSLELANYFLGSNEGKIANAVDIAEARIRNGFDTLMWKTYFTTSSTEWMGLNKEGEMVIVILHDLPPFWDVEYLRKNYIPKNHKKVSSVSGSSKGFDYVHVVSRQMFLDICDGKYGKVFQIKLEDVLEKENNNINYKSFMTKEELLANELFIARVGGEEIARKYVEAHYNFSEKNSKNWNDDRFGPNHCTKALIKTSLEVYECFMKVNLQNIKNKYFDYQQSFVDFKSSAVSHFIDFGRPEENFSLSSSVDVSDCYSNYAFLAILTKPGENFVRFKKGRLIDYSSDKYKKNLFSFFTDECIKVEKESFYEVENLDKVYVTLHHRNSLISDEEEKPYFLVRKLDRLAQRTINLSHEGKKAFNYQSVKKLAPSGTNAFKLSVKDTGEGDKPIEVFIYYFKAEFFKNSIFATEEQVVADWNLLGRIF